jgi:phospholipid/cholesterol/gamma-HCH transport system permease protein
MSFSCAACGITLTVPRSMAGVSGPCPSCARVITAPSALPTPPPNAGPPEKASFFSRIGDHTLFYGKAIAGIPQAVVRYRTEIIRLIAEISMGAGTLAMIGGTVAIVGFLTLAAGGTLAVQGYSSLGNIGVEALTGFLAAFINVRISAPVVAGIGLAATFGAGVTAQLGAMRINEEIDALETMGIRPIEYLVSTRLVAGMIAITPLYSVAVILSFLASKFVTVVLFGQSAGLYDHYFNTFLNPIDLLWSFFQAVLMAITILLIHTYFGYFATGGPSGVGVAVGNAVRTSLIVVVSVTLLVSLAVYGSNGNFNLAG